MDALDHRRCWYPAFVFYRWRHVMWTVPLLALLGLVVMHWNRLRWDHAMTAVQLRPTGTSGPSPVPVRGLSERHADLSSMVLSSSVLGQAVRITALDEVWQTREAQATERLRSMVVLDPVPGTGLVEVRVRKIPEGDSRMVCEAIVNSAREHAKAEMVTELKAEIALWKAEAKNEEAELNAIRAKWREDDANKRESSKESVDRFNEHMRVLEMIRAKVLSDELDVLWVEAPFFELSVAHWPGRPASRHLQHFGICAAWTFGLSVMVAIASAYLLEGLIQRRKEADEITPEGEPAHG